MNNFFELGWLKIMKIAMNRVVLLAVAFLFLSAAHANGVEIEQPGKTSVAAVSGQGQLLLVDTSYGRVSVIVLKGTHYEMGRQYGVLLGQQIAVITKAMDLSMVMGGEHSKEDLNRLVAALWEIMSPHVPDAFKDEIKGIVEGARESGAEISELDLIAPLVITNISDMNDKDSLLGGKSSLHPLLDEFAYTCSAFAVWGDRTVGGKLFSSRVLDWKPGTGTDRFKLITVYEPVDEIGNKGNAYMTAGYIGLIGATNGMNDKGITVSEIGSENAVEKLDGMPWTLMFRKVLEDSDSLDQAVEIIQAAENTIGYNFVIGDGDAENFGTQAWQPRAAEIEENGQYTVVMYDDDPVDRDAAWIDSSGNKVLVGGAPVQYGTPLKWAVLRADVAMSPEVRKTQTAGNGPGNADGGGNPLEVRSYRNRHRSQYDGLMALEAGGAFNNPYTGEPVFQATGETRLVDPETALEIASAAAMPDQNVLTIVYSATDLDFYVSWENSSGDEWQPAFKMPFLKLSLKGLLAKE
jgi:predicted choloylglycine hydrolase